jgi:hypothetical protein
VSDASATHGHARAGTPEEAAASGVLVAYALVVVVGACVALILVAQAYPVLSTISVDAASPRPDVAVVLGVAFWVLFGAGDEFAILLRDVGDASTALRLAWRLHEALVRPVRVRGESLEVSVGASIGVATVGPMKAASVSHLKRLADERMQTVKRAGGGVLGPPTGAPAGPGSSR